MASNSNSRENSIMPAGAAHFVICLGFIIMLSPVLPSSTVAAQTARPADQARPVLDLDPERPLLTLERRSSDRARKKADTGAVQKPIPPSNPRSDPGPRRYSTNPTDVEQTDLAPVTDQEGTGLPVGVWQGMDAGSLENLFAKIDLPPRSPVLNDLWTRFLLSRDSFGQNPQDPRFEVLKLEALFRSGRFEEIVKVADVRRAAAPLSPMLVVIHAKALLGLVRIDEACNLLKSTAAANKEMPKSLKLQSVKMSIFCRAAKGDYAAANLFMDLARDQGLDTPFAFDAVVALEAGRRAPRPPSTKLDLIDYRFLMLFKRPLDGKLIRHASAPVLSAILFDKNLTLENRLAVAERAFKLNIISARRLAAVYGAVRFAPGDLNNPLAAVSKYRNRPESRALLYRALENTRDPVRAAKLARALMASSKSAGLYLHMPFLLGSYIDQMPQTAALAWFAETAVEISLASGNYEKSLSWAVFGSADNAGQPRKLLNWLTLIDIGAPANTVPRGAGLSTTEESALAGQFSPDTLHRLVTILDALKYDVPVRLWNRASNSPQPSSGHLPETGLLSKLQIAADQQKYGQVILYSIIALGKDGPPDAHIIALGDTLRAMTASGLKSEARRVALEALYSVWPRHASY